MLKIEFTTRFKKDYKRIQKQEFFNKREFDYVVGKLANQDPLEPKYCDHELKGEYVGHRECHIKPDWLLVYKIKDDILILTLTRTGTHSDLF